MKEILIDKTLASPVAIKDSNNPPHIIFLLDKSGSMGVILDATINNFNSFLSKQKELDEKAFMTLILFDTNYNMLFSKRDINKVSNLTRNNYIPDGATALLDAMAKAMLATNDKNILLVILTDGEENSSREYKDRGKVFSIREQKEKDGWKFLYLGAGEDSIKDALSIGISKGDTMTWVASAIGTQSAYADINTRSLNYRKGNN